MSTTLTPYIVCRNASEAVEFYKKAFGAESMGVFKVPDGRVMHAALNINGASVFIMDEFPEHGGVGPETLGGSPITLHLQVPNCDEVFERAVNAGCKVTMPMQDMFWGDRYGQLSDPYGHKWSVATNIRKVTPEELQAAMSAMA